MPPHTMSPHAMPPYAGLADIVKIHLEKIMPSLKQASSKRNGLVLFALLIQASTLTSDKQMQSSGDCVLMGPLNLCNKDSIYDLYPNHMPVLKARVDTGVPGNLLIITCNTAIDGGSEIHQLHTLLEL